MATHQRDLNQCWNRQTSSSRPEATARSRQPRVLLPDGTFRWPSFLGTANNIARSLGIEGPIAAPERARLARARGSIATRFRVRGRIAGR